MADGGGGGGGGAVDCGNGGVVDGLWVVETLHLHHDALRRHRSLLDGGVALVMVAGIIARLPRARVATEKPCTQTNKHCISVYLHTFVVVVVVVVVEWCGGGL